MSVVLRVDFDIITRAVITEVTVRRATVSGVVYDTAPVDLPVRALWDTGAGMSVISAPLAEQLGVSVVHYGTITGIGGAVLSKLYDLSVALPNKVIFPVIRVAEWEGHRLYDMLIGMDIISQGEFFLSNATGKTRFTFKV